MKCRYAAGIATLSLCLGAAVAQAQYYYQPPEGAGPYFRMGVGPSFFQNSHMSEPDAAPPSPGTVKYRTGLAADAAFGYAFNKYAALDFELGYVGAKIDSVPGYFANNSYVYNVPFLANVTLSYPVPHTIMVPYVGVGVGGADVIFDADNFQNIASGDVVDGKENDVVFAWQAFAGVRFQLARNLSLGIGYKFFATEDPSFTYPPDNFHVNFDGARTHSVMASLEWRFW